MSFWRQGRSLRFGAVMLSSCVTVGLASTAIAHREPASISINSAAPLQIAQSRGSATPFYQPTAPPAGIDPLPDERNQQEQQPPVTDPRIPALQRDYRGNLWIGGWRGLAQIDPNTGKIIARVNVPSDEVNALAEDKSGRLWVGTYEGLWRVDPRTKEITAANYTLPSNRVLALQIDQRGYLWVGTDRGLALISPIGVC